MLLSWNLGTLTSWNSLGHSRLVTGLYYLYVLQPTDLHSEDKGTLRWAGFEVISYPEHDNGFCPRNVQFLIVCIILWHKTMQNIYQVSDSITDRVSFFLCHPVTIGTLKNFKPFAEIPLKFYKQIYKPRKCDTVGHNLL